MEQDQIVNELLSSPKYRTLSRQLVEQIVQDSIMRYGKKRALKESKGKLLQVWGSYLTGKLNYRKLLEVLNSSDIDQFVPNALLLHASTKERVENIRSLYSFINRNCTDLLSVVDLGAGFFPLTLVYSGWSKSIRFDSYDIDREQADFLNQFFQKAGYPNAVAHLATITQMELPRADLILMLKFLPVVEQLQKGKGLQLINELDCRYCLVTFPLKSLGGREKGMGSSYSIWFEQLLERTTREFSVQKEEIGEELCYLLSFKS